MFRILILSVLCSGSALVASSNIPTGYCMPEEEPVVVVEEANSWEDTFFSKLFKAVGIAAAAIAGVAVVGLVAVCITLAVLVYVAPAVLIAGPVFFLWAALALSGAPRRY